MYDETGMENMKCMMIFAKNQLLNDTSLEHITTHNNNELGSCIRKGTPKNIAG